MAQTAATLDALVANAPLGFGFFDRDHRYVRVNAVLAGFNGKPIEAHLGERVREIVPVDPKPFDTVLEHVFKTGAPAPAFKVDGKPGPDRRFHA